MSLILEALRKSEAERQRGRAPDLHAALNAPRGVRERRVDGPVAFVVLALAGIAVAAGLWRDRLMPDAATPTAAPAMITPPSRIAPAVSAEAPPMPRPVTAAAAQRPAPASTAPPRTTADAPTVKVSSTRTESAANAAKPAPDASAIAIDEPATPEPQHASSVRQLGDLDSATRAQLPALKVSMHVWNDDPQQRFALIDGQRLGEGGQIGDALVERIDRDGVVLAWRGERLRLPRP